MKKGVKKTTVKEVFQNLFYYINENGLILFFPLALVVKITFFSAEIKTLHFLLANFIIFALTVLLWFSPFVFLKKHKNKAIIGTALLLTLIIIVDLVYVRYYSSLPTLALVANAPEATGVIPAILSLFRLSDLFYFIDFVIFIPIFLLIKGKKPSEILFSRQFSLVFCLLPYLGFLLLLVHDSSTFLPFYINNVLDNKVVTERYGILGAHYIDIYKNLSLKAKRATEEDKKKVTEYFKEKSFSQNSFTGTAKDKNIIILQVESLQNGVINKKVNGQEITPNLNKLAKESHYFDNHYFEMGLGSTSDVDFTINTSLYPLKTAAASVRYGKNDYSSLPKEVKKAGYGAFAYHGFNKSFWNREVFFRSLGYEKYYAKESYPKGEVINMGLNDRDFLLQTADYIKAQPKPSFNYVITLTSHYPFYAPENHRPLNIKEADYPDFTYGYLQNVNYVDAAIGEFIDALKKEGLYQETLLVVTGDHMPRIGDFETEQGIVSQKQPEERKVPLFIHLPGQENGKIHRTVSSHLDIMPTVLNLVGAKSTAPILGRDLFSVSEPFFSSVLYYDQGLSTNGNFSYLFGNIEGEGICYLAKEREKTESKNCESLITRKRKEQEISELLIRFNLFSLIGT